MGDVRYDPALRRVRTSKDPAREIRSLSDEQVIEALAAASKQLDPYYANVLATEASNRATRAIEFDERLARQNAALVDLMKRIGPLARDRAAMLRAITETAAVTMDVSRASVWLFTEDGEGIRCIDLFEADLDRHFEGTLLMARDYPRYFEALDEARTIPAHDARTDPRTREFTEPYLDVLGIGAMLDAPLRVGGKVAGVVRHEHVGGPRVWLPDEQQFAASIGACVELALETHRRAQLEDLLKDAGRLSAVIAKAADLAGVGIGVVVSDGGRLRVMYVNETAARMGGRTPEEMLGLDPLEAIAQEDRERVLAAIEGVDEGGRATMHIRFLHPDGTTTPVEIGITRTTYHGAPTIIGFAREIRPNMSAREGPARAPGPARSG